jgi:oxysterol-binding protein 1
MKHARLKLDQSDKLKFDIVSNGKNAVRYHLRANHPVEANRWIFALTQAIQLATPEPTTSTLDDGASHHHRTASTTIPERPVGHRSTSSLDLSLQKLPHNSSVTSLNTDDESEGDSPEHYQEPHRGDFEVTAHSAQVQLEILEKLLGALPQSDQQSHSPDDPSVILTKAVSSLHGTLDELVRMRKGIASSLGRKHANDCGRARKDGRSYEPCYRGT